MKEKLCYIPTKHGGVPGEDEYELPDGSTVTLDSKCRSQAAEVGLECYRSVIFWVFACTYADECLRATGR